jgi:hypothetical protein
LRHGLATEDAMIASQIEQEKTMTMIERIDLTELNESELDDVTGAGLLHFIKAIVVPGTAEAGGSGATDPNTTTHTQVWVISGS